MAKILVVEDEQMIMDLISMVLGKNHELIHTPNGSQAVNMARVSEPALILLDIMLPGLDGFSIQNKLYEDEELKKIPIIMMTSKSQMEDVFKTSPNVVGFIAKPFSIKEMEEKVNAVLNQAK